MFSPCLFLSILPAMGGYTIWSKYRVTMYGLRVNIGSQYLVSKSGLKILSPHLGCFQYLVTWGLACFLLSSSSRLLARASSPLTPSSKLACSEIIIMIRVFFYDVYIKRIFFTGSMPADEQWCTWSSFPKPVLQMRALSLSQLHHHQDFSLQQPRHRHP